MKNLNPSSELIPLPINDRLALTVIFNRKLRIIPKLDTKAGYRYPEAEEIFGLSDQETIEKLEYFSKLGFFERVYYITLLKCPSCGDFKMLLVLRCPKCNSPHIVKGVVLRHYKCGADGFEEEFIKEGVYICPRCNIKIDKPGVDFKNIGVWYKCLKCGEFFGESLEKLYCFKCDKEFLKEECVLQPVWGYDINENRLKEVILDIELETVKKYLEEQWNVELFSKVRGESGIEHMFTFRIFTKKPLSDEVIVDVEYSKSPISQDVVMRLFAKKVDVFAIESVLIAIPRLEEGARRLSDRYGIKVIEVESLKDAIEPLKEIIKRVLR